MVEHFFEKHSIDSFVFCWLFFQITTIDFVYKLLPNFFIPSFIMAVMPVIASWLCILFEVIRCRYVHRDVVIFFVCVIGILLCSLFGNIFLQSVAFTSSFLVLITACIFLYTRKDIRHLFLHIIFDFLLKILLDNHLQACIITNAAENANNLQMHTKCKNK